MQGDPFIRRGYRNQLNRFTSCFYSLFYLHNESINTWSHLLAAVYFLLIIVRPRYITAQYDKFSATDKKVLLLYNLGTAGCSIFSVGCFLPFPVSYPLLHQIL
jgi:adiponectin receptor